MLNPLYIHTDPNHSDIMKFAFPNEIKNRGVDLPKFNKKGYDIEIKESFTKRKKICFNRRDYKYPYLIALIQVNYCYYILPTRLLPKIKKGSIYESRTFAETQLNRICLEHIDQCIITRCMKRVVYIRMLLGLGINIKEIKTKIALVNQYLNK